MKKLILTLILPTITQAYPNTDTVNMKYGFAVIQKGEAEFISFGVQKRIFSTLYRQTEGGFWIDRNRGNSGFGVLSLGIHVDNELFYGETMHGIGLISRKDKLLGGHFQFFHDVGTGIVSRNGSTFGIQIKHISSAGINTPNIGRNFISIKAGFTY